MPTEKYVMPDFLKILLTTVTLAGEKLAATTQSTEVDDKAVELLKTWLQEQEYWESGVSIDIDVPFYLELIGEQGAKALVAALKVWVEKTENKIDDVILYFVEKIVAQIKFV